MKYAIRMIIVIVVCLLGAGNSVYAVSMYNWDSEPAHRDYANPVVGWMETQSAEVGPRYACVVNLNNEWGLTVAHAFERRDGTNSEPYQVGFGSNVFEDPGPIRLIDDYAIYPDWNRINTHDIALVHYATPVYNVPTATITEDAPDIGEHIQFTGYGRPGVQLYWGDYDGIRRGWEGEVERFGFFGKIPEYFLTSEWFYPGAGSYPLGGLATPGDSGGGCFDDDGFLLALITGASDTYNTYFNETFAVGLWEPEVQSWINDNTPLTAEVPIPPTAFLLLGGILLMICRRQII